MRLKYVVLFFVILGACARAVSPVGATSYGAGAKACLAEAMYFEARGTGAQGRRAVGEVILNRADDPRFPATVCGVVDQRTNGSCQFSYRCDSIPEVYREPAERLKALRMAATLLGNRGRDITGGALYFHAASMPPGWFGTLHRLGQFGGNIFYR